MAEFMDVHHGMVGITADGLMEAHNADLAILCVPRDVNYFLTVPATTRIGPPTTFTLSIEPEDGGHGAIADNVWAGWITWRGNQHQY